MGEKVEPDSCLPSRFASKTFSLVSAARALRAYKNRQSNSGVVDLRRSADLCSTKIISTSVECSTSVKSIANTFSLPKGAASIPEEESRGRKAEHMSWSEARHEDPSWRSWLLVAFVNRFRVYRPKFMRFKLQNKFRRQFKAMTTMALTA